MLPNAAGNIKLIFVSSTVPKYIVSLQIMFAAGEEQSILTTVVWIYERNSFPTQSVTIKL